MSNKSFKELNKLDQQLRTTHPPRMEDAGKDQVVIRKVCGFEYFNTRPYHNHEAFSDGYVVEDDEINTNSEDLDDAIKNYVVAKNLKIEGWVSGNSVYLPESPTTTIARIKDE